MIRVISYCVSLLLVKHARSLVDTDMHAKSEGMPVVILSSIGIKTDWMTMTTR